MIALISLVFLLCVVGFGYCFWGIYAIAQGLEHGLGRILARLKEIEDTRPVNKINIVSDATVPNGYAYTLADKDE